MRLYHGSHFRHAILSPGIKHTGKLVRWGQTESNEWLYASSDRGEAVLNGFASAISQHFQLERIRWGVETITVYLANADVIEKQLTMLDVYLYHIERGSEDLLHWQLVNNPHNHSVGEYKTKRDIVPVSCEQIKDPTLGRKLLIRTQTKRMSSYFNW